MRIALLRRLAVVTTLAAGLLAVSPGASQAVNDPIQPGQRIETSAGLCTSNFVYNGTGARLGKTYIGTAAHCVVSVGQDVVLSATGEVFGDVAAIGDADFDATDWALIEIRPAFLARVNPAVKGNTSYPTGVTTAATTATGDQVQISGYGTGFEISNLSRERRTGTLTYDDANIHEVIAPLIFGDSGGPLVHIPTGRALGIVSRLCVGTCEEVGPTVQGLMAKAAAAGFPTTLRTV